MGEKVQSAYWAPEFMEFWYVPGAFIGDDCWELYPGDRIVYLVHPMGHCEGNFALLPWKQDYTDLDEISDDIKQL